MDIMKINVGKNFVKSFTVSEFDTARAVKSGGLEVLSTPILIAYMESTCFFAVEDFLDDVDTTVGIEIKMKHLASTPVGKTVTVNAKIEKYDRNIITFKLEACDESETIGVATHKRAIVNKEDFLKKAMRKLEKAI